MALNLCCRLENAANVANPEIGVGGAEVGSPTYVASKFGNGILSDANSEGCTFPTAGNNINLDKGTIEFWAKMNFALDDVDFHCLFSFTDVAAGGIYLLFLPAIDDFRVYIYSDGSQKATATTTDLSWIVGDLLHFAVTWDREGNDIGGGKTVVLYINDVEEASSTSTWNTDTVNANLCIGIRHDGLRPSDAVIDNIKTYDTCKIDFSDKDTEGCETNNAPTAPTAQQVGGQSSPTGANCISSLTPGFTAIFNDPDAGDISNAINIQVGSASGLSDMWDSGWLADSTVTPNRCSAKTYAGAALSSETSYWWRCRFRDDGDAVGAWSAWQQFDMCAIGAGAQAMECAPGGPLPKRRPFMCAARVPALEPSKKFPFEFPALRFPGY